MEVSKYKKSTFNKKQKKTFLKKYKNKIGQWSKEEHKIFIQSLLLYGNGWKKVILYYLIINFFIFR